MSGTWYYTWKSNRISDDNIPRVPHYAVLVYHDHSYYEAPRDVGDPEEHRTVRVCDYYAFADKSQWEQMIADIYAEKHKLGMYTSDKKENVVFFHSSGRGSVDVKININVNIDEDDGCNPMQNLGYGRGD